MSVAPLAAVSAEDGLPPAQRIPAVLALLLGTFLATLDGAIANIALPSIAADLGGTPAEAVWVVNSFALAVAVSLLPFAALGEIIGLKRLYLGGLVVFTLASVACALAPGLGTLIAARAVQGLGSAMCSVVGGALIRTVFPARLAGRGISLLGLTVAISAALGPSVAAAILSVATWRWLFLVNLPLGAIALLVAWRFLPASPPRERPFDAAGAVLNALFFGLLVLGLGGLGERGWAAPAEIVAGLVFGALLLRHQNRQEHPLVPLDLLRIPVLALSVVTSNCSYAAQAIAYIALPFFLQHGLGRDEVSTGLLITPWPLVITVVAPLSGRLSDRYSAGILSSAGLAALAAGLLALAFLPAEPANWDIVWRTALCGIGFGFFQTPNNRAMLTSGPTSRLGAASGLMSVARLVGTTTGAALVTVIFEVWGVNGTEAALLLAAGFAAVGAVVSVSRLGGGRAA